jgi:hypothetical protein
MHESLTSFAVTSETSVVVEPVWLGANRPAVRGHDRVCGGSHDRISAGAAHHRIAAVGRGDGLGRRLGHRLASACCVGVSTGDLAAADFGEWEGIINGGFVGYETGPIRYNTHFHTNVKISSPSHCE